MAADITDFVTGIGSKKTIIGISFEQLMLILYPVFLIPVVLLWYSDLRKRKSPPPGLVKLCLAGDSHAADEYDEKYDEGTKDEKAWKVKALYMHPIKSCAAIELDVADIDAEGLTYDRKFCFAEMMTPIKPDSDGKKIPKWTFRTLRQEGYEKLAQVKPEVWLPKSVSQQNEIGLRQIDREGCLIVKYPNVPTGVLAPLERLAQRWRLVPAESSFRMPLNPGKDHTYPREVMNIWKDDPVWINMGRHVPDDFKQWLGIKRPFSLFRVDPEKYREVFRCAPRQEDIGFQPAVGAQDAYPVHLLNLASVHDVGKRVGKDVIDGLSVRRFRGNIIIEGPPAYDEDDWKMCRVGEHELYCACHTVRCRVS